MMPDLGAYALPVLAAYAGGILALLGLTIQSLWKARRSKIDLAEIERTRKDG